MIVTRATEDELELINTFLCDRIVKSSMNAFDIMKFKLNHSGESMGVVHLVHSITNN